MKRRILNVICAGAVLLASCAPAAAPGTAPPPTATEPATLTPDPLATPLPTRALLDPGELVSYRAQSGDTLPAIAAHFNTTVEEIRAANPSLPDPVTTLPVGYPLEIPAYHLPLTGTPFQILPDSELTYGPGAIGFEPQTEVRSHPGYLAEMSDYAFARERPAWGVVNVVASNYSIHPRLLLTLLEHQTQALSNPFPGEVHTAYPLGYENPAQRGLYRQLVWAAERLNDGFYGWRSGKVREFETADGFLVRPDPWQNAGTVALQRLFAAMYDRERFEHEIGPAGFYQTYRELWGDPFELGQATIPGNLQQPELVLPFMPDKVWDFTGGPHPSWGDSLPWGALDFAPPAVEGGCAPSNEWVAAPAAGVITRSERSMVMMDLDGDGDERTGWVLLFFHLATRDRIAAGVEVAQGDPIGHPSCEGGRSTGTHFHMARKFNGEWLPAAGAVPFTLDRWVAEEGDSPYEGTLVRGARTVPACTCSRFENRIIYDLQPSSDMQEGVP